MVFTLITFTLIHVILSLVGIVSGLVVAGALTAGVRLGRWSLLFLVTTIAANATSFGFPFVTLMPSYFVAVLSLIVLLVVVVAEYVKRLAGGWRRTYVIGVVTATYFNFFVLVTQQFRRLPALMAAAPTQSEPPFAITQVLVLALFVWLGIAAVKGFRAAPTGTQ